MRGNCSSLWGRWYVQVCVKVTGRVKWEACAAAVALPNSLAFGKGIPEIWMLTLPCSTDWPKHMPKKVFVRVEEGGNSPGDHRVWGSSLPKAFHLEKKLLCCFSPPKLTLLITTCNDCLQLWTPLLAGKARVMCLRLQNCLITSHLIVGKRNSLLTLSSLFEAQLATGSKSVPVPVLVPPLSH